MPLSGIRIVDLTRILAGPFCTMILADMGAEIIKIETPGAGDPLRQQGAIRDGLSWYFAAFNRNKRSLSLNLRSDKGKAVLARLIAGSDVLVENYRPGVLAAMDDWDAKDHPASLDAFDWRAFQRQYRDHIDLAKLAQFIPIVGAPLGAIVNWRLTERLGKTAVMAYRMRAEQGAYASTGTGIGNPLS